MSQIHLPDFMAVTFGLLAFLLGEGINKRVEILRRFNIPDPVTGGILMALAFFAVYRLGIAEVSFDTGIRDLLLLVFFTGIGLNASLADLRKGGRPLVILIGLTSILLILQNVLGGLGALVSGLPMAFGAALGSAALLGGHGTIIAWTGEFEAMGLAGAPEAGIAMATLGLVAGAVVGGPFARFMIERGGLRSEDSDEVNTVGLAEGSTAGLLIVRSEFMHVVLVTFLCMIGGYALQQSILAAGLNLPAFVPCLIVGMIVGNLLKLVPRIPPVSHTPSLSLLSEFALGVFLAISLMSLQLWALAGMAGTLMLVLAAQTALALALAYFAAFRYLGRDYDAAVMTAGYSSFVLGATPTAIATMTAVTKRYGPAPAAFIVLPLVSALFVDLANALVTQGYLMLWGS